MFGKKSELKSKEEPISTADENQDLNSTNIFDEFSTDDSIEAEVQKLKEEQNKDLYYFLNIFGNIFQNIFILGIFVIMAFIGYIYIQNNKLIYDKGFLDPVCKFIIGDTPIPENTTFCSSLSYTESYYTDELENIKLEYSQNIFSMLIGIYESENFSKTKEVSFLLNKTETKLKTLDIIEKFDKLKLDFLGIEKRRVQCNNLMIDSNTSILTMDCESYSKGYESNIIGFSGNKTDSTIGGTSISVANSFLNFIEKNSVDFELINRQKIFDTVNTVGEKSGYTMKTPFDISLKINF